FNVSDTIIPSSIDSYFYSYSRISLNRGSDKMGSRKKNWSDKEDQLLADKVIQYTKIGKTQLEAFKDVSKELNRTPSACGYRWNAKLGVFARPLEKVYFRIIQKYSP